MYRASRAAGRALRLRQYSLQTPQQYLQHSQDGWSYLGCSHRFLSSLATTQSNLPSNPIDFSISAKIEGEESQVAMVTLREGETLRAESGAMLFMTQGVEMNTDLHGASAAFSRMLTGQNVFLTEFTYKGSGEGKVGLGTDFPSKILRLTLEDYPESTLICQRGAYMASNPTVDIAMEVTKSLSAGFFGGQGFILQRLSGQGDVLVKAGGTLVEKDLREGETIRVTSGSIVAFTRTVDYDIQMMPGIKNAMFGGEGLFVTTLKGPGKVWLQGMPADRMIAEIARRVPSGGPGIGIPIGMGGSGGGGGEEEEAAAEMGAGSAAEAGAAGVAGDVVGETGGGSPDEMVAATDHAIEADRQATVATSGIMDDSSSSVDSDSPSALFGDVAPEDVDGLSTPSMQNEEPSFSSSDETTFQETTFTDDGTPSMTDDSSFSDETSFSSSEFEQPRNSQDDWWGEGDPTTTDVFESGSGAADEVAEQASSTASNIFSTLWDLFSGGDE